MTNEKIVRFEFRGTLCSSGHLRRILSDKVLDIKKQNPRLPIEAIMDYVGNEIGKLKLNIDSAEDYFYQHTDDNIYSVENDWHHTSLTSADLTPDVIDWNGIESTL